MSVTLTVKTPRVTVPETLPNVRRVISPSLVSSNTVRNLVYGYFYGLSHRMFV